MINTVQQVALRALALIPGNAMPADGGRIAIYDAILTGEPVDATAALHVLADIYPHIRRGQLGAILAALLGGREREGMHPWRPRWEAVVTATTRSERDAAIRQAVAGRPTGEDD